MTLLVSVVVASTTMAAGVQRHLLFHSGLLLSHLLRCLQFLPRRLLLRPLLLKRTGPRSFPMMIFSGLAVASTTPDIENMHNLSAGGRGVREDLQLDIPDDLTRSKTGGTSSSCACEACRIRDIPWKGRGTPLCRGASTDDAGGDWGSPVFGS
mmetsp:Transcript_82708/g.208107  ORF Transcript_82708/g.208107 Transcript_82708/m.208107 type:complete len:153 (-) Transcript_82708:8-466(-)